VKLTIYIPTFQRTEIRDCIQSIIPELRPEVEVIISDNDGFAKNLVPSHPRIKYTKRLFNIEGDPNVLRGLVCGTGEYVWVFGDDDTMLPGTMDALLPMLDGVDRVIHWSPNAGEVNPGFDGTMAGYIASLSDQSILVASTLITANVWKRNAMNVALGLEKVDTKYPLFWAGLQTQTIKVMPQPTITVGYVHQNRFDFFGDVMREYLAALAQTHGFGEGYLGNAFNWNFVKVSLRKR
jgi:hypothetical protein